MKTTHEVHQATRVSIVSDALDSLPREQAAAVWNKARDMFEQGECSFLTAFERALPPRGNNDEQ